MGTKESAKSYLPGTILRSTSTLFVVVSREQSTAYLKQRYPDYPGIHSRQTELPGSFQEAYLPGTEVRKREKNQDWRSGIPFMVTSFNEPCYQEATLEEIAAYKSAVQTLKASLRQQQNPLLKDVEMLLEKKLRSIALLEEFLGFLQIHAQSKPINF